MGKFPLLGWFLDEWFYAYPEAVKDVDLSGKVVLVTGANAGIGYEAAKHFAAMNPARLIMACRSEQKGQEAARSIEKDTGYKPEVMVLDLASFDSVSSFADKFEKEVGRLDIFVANAAIVPGDKAKAERTADGWEITTQVNVLSTALLSILLVPTLTKTARLHGTRPRIVIVVSSIHFWVTLGKDLIARPSPLQAFSSDEFCTPKTLGTRYEESKLIDVLFTRALAERLAHTPIIVNAVCPGLCYSNIRSNRKGLDVLADRVAETLFAHTAEVGSRNILYGAVGGPANVEDLHGAYVYRCDLREPSDYAVSSEGAFAQEKLWDNLVDELNQVNPKVGEVAEAHFKKSQT